MTHLGHRGPISRSRSLNELEWAERRRRQLTNPLAWWALSNRGERLEGAFVASGELGASFGVALARAVEREERGLANLRAAVHARRRATLPLEPARRS
jgi:hypothetical protein